MSNIPHFENIVISLKIVQNKIGAFLDQDQYNELMNSIYLTDSSNEEKAVEGLINALKLISEIEIGRIFLVQTLRSFGLDVENDISSSIRSLVVIERKKSTPLLYCPADPAHYSKRQSFPNEKILCPLHKMELVPENVDKMQ